MKLVNVPYNQKLEDTKSKEFQQLASNLEGLVSMTSKDDPMTFLFIVPFLLSTLFIVNLLALRAFLRVK